MTRIPALGAAAFCALAWPALAASPHQHGVARLDVGVESGRVTLELEMPLDNAVGFERAPRDDAERQRLDAALARLRDGAALFGIDPSAGCTLAAAEADTRLDGGHADIDARWEFGCQDAARAGFVEVHLFSAFARLQRLDVQTATPRGQMKATLRRGSTRLPLAR